mmetsp:Transcript_73580/g.204469  ORF Transcript_73580/g.204469 Transcript_73580/m.204469 type:complete len:441 (+) Transcript_73580:681-2003(+)
MAVTFFPLAHEDQLDSSGHAIAFVAHEPGDHCGDQLHTLLVTEAAAEAHERHVRVLVQPEPSLQLGLGNRLPLLVISERVAHGDVRVRLGVPLVGNAIQDTAEPQMRALLHEVQVRAVATLWALDLHSVTGRHCEYAVGELDGSHEQVHAINAHVQVLALKIRRGLAGEAEVRVHGECAQAVLPLIAHVVDDEDASGASVSVVPAVLVQHVHWHQSSLPIVRDEKDVLAIDRALQVQDQRGLQGRDREQREAEEIVGILAALRGIPVEAAGPVEALMLHENVISAATLPVLLALVEELYLVVLAVEPNLREANVRTIRVVRVTRRHHHRPMPANGELVAIRPRDHRQAARLGPRVHLRRDDDNRGLEVPRLVPHPRLLGGGHVQAPSQLQFVFGCVEQIVQRGQTVDAGHGSVLRYILRRHVLQHGRTFNDLGHDFALAL